MDHRNQPGMNQKPKSRSQTYRTSKRKHWEDLHNHRIDEDFLNMM